MPFGLPGATAICSRFVAKTVADPSTSPAAVTFRMLTSSADANTSAGAPFTICVASVDDEPKLKVMCAPG